MKASSTVSDTLRLRVYTTKAQETCESLGYPSHLNPSLPLPTCTGDSKHLVAVHTFLTEAAFLVEHVLWSVEASVVVPRGLSSCGTWTTSSCPAACGIFMDQVLNLCLLALAGRFFTAEPQGTPTSVLLPDFSTLTVPFLYS